MPQFGGGAKCPRCGKTVYQAEEMLAAGEKWHKTCFSCKDCSKKLESTTLAERKDTDANGKKTVEIYCKGCYGKHFGPAGYGFGAGAGVMRTDFGGGIAPGGHTPAGYGSSSSGAGGTGGKRCPRCNNRVYAAEEVIGAGASWHKGCFSCKDCTKKLDSTTVSDKEGEVYCKACYGKNFGPKGFGFGQGAGALTLTK